MKQLLISIDMIYNFVISHEYNKIFEEISFILMATWYKLTNQTGKTIIIKHFILGGLSEEDYPGYWFEVKD